MGAGIFSLVPKDFGQSFMSEMQEQAEFKQGLSDGPDSLPRRDAGPTVEILGEIPRFDQRDQQHTRAAVGALGEKIQKAWTAESVDPFRRIFHPNNRPFNVPLRSLMSVAEGPLNPVVAPVRDPAKMAAHIKEVAKFLGAHIVGVCELQPWMVYSHRGLRIDARKGTWGDPIEIPHRFAISIAHEMNYERLRYSPSFIDGAEVGLGYLDGAVISTSLACYIRELGYPATAHFHVCEKVLHVPIAVMAGIGELARNNTLITPKFGPRVRLATVTTDLPLAVDQPIDIGVQAFCEDCNKCAKLCPSQCISYGPKQVERNYRHWVTNNDKCVSYWNVNTKRFNDCARCITVCPWNKPDRWWYRLGMKLAQKGPVARKLLLWIDDLIWSKKFHLQSGPGWLMYDRKTSADKFELHQIHPKA
jgi:reductive dehalogenase